LNRTIDFRDRFSPRRKEMRQRSTQVFLLEKDRDRAAEIGRLIGDEHSITVAGSTGAAIEALARGQKLIAVADVRSELFGEIASLASIPALAGEIGLVVTAPEPLGASNAGAAHFPPHEFAALSGGSPALSAAIVASQRRLAELEGVLQLGCTTLHFRENLIITPKASLHVQLSTAALLEALMRAHPKPVGHAALLTDVVRFAPDAQSGAVHTRIYQLRRALREAESDIAVDFVDGQGYKLSAACAESGG
jgi:DNA-binding winged helix-turn-helix (wHTH) protein